MHMRKKHLFLKAKLTEFANTDALPPDERAERRGTLESGKTANVILFFFRVLKSIFKRGVSKFYVKTSFDHNFSRLARIAPRFCRVAKLEELNNFCLDRNKGYP